MHFKNKTLYNNWNDTFLAAGDGSDIFKIFQLFERNVDLLSCFCFCHELLVRTICSHNVQCSRQTNNNLNALHRRSPYPKKWKYGQKILTCKVSGYECTRSISEI